MLFALMLLAATQDAPAPQPTPPPAKPKKICRNVESSTSRLGVGKVCRTAEEWAKEDERGDPRVLHGSKSDDGTH